jgi:hypothetical protein
LHCLPNALAALSFGFGVCWRAARYLEKEKLRRISNELEKRGRFL